MSNSPLHSADLHDFSDLQPGSRERWVIPVALVGVGYYIGQPHLSSSLVASEEAAP